MRWQRCQGGTRCWLESNFTNLRRTATEEEIELWLSATSDIPTTRQEWDRGDAYYQPHDAEEDYAMMRFLSGISLQLRTYKDAAQAQKQWTFIAKEALQLIVHINSLQAAIVQSHTLWITTDEGKPQLGKEHNYKKFANFAMFFLWARRRNFWRAVILNERKTILFFPDSEANTVRW